MRDHTHEDPWLLPSDQFDYPTREVLPESRMHGRREGTFLVLVAMFLTSTITLVLAGATRVIDLSAVLARVIPGFDAPVAMALPIGVLLFPLGFVAVGLVCELYSRRRATALVWIGLVVMLGMIGLARITDAVGGADAAFGPAVAFAACYLVANLCHAYLFEAMRVRTAGYGLWWRSVLTAVVAQLVGWVAFAFALYAYQVQITGAAGPGVTAPITALAVGAFAYTAVCTLVLVVPLVLATRSLAVYLRVGRFGERDDDVDVLYREGPSLVPTGPRFVRPVPPAPSSRKPLPRALIVDSSPALPRVTTPPAKPRALLVDSSPALPPVAAPQPVLAESSPVPAVVAPKPTVPPAVRREGVSERRAARQSIQPFNSAEMRFFTEGDELVEAGESSPDLSAAAKRAQA